MCVRERASWLGEGNRLYLTLKMVFKQVVLQRIVDLKGSQNGPGKIQKFQSFIPKKKLYPFPYTFISSYI